jgi:hypothetical protein
LCLRPKNRLALDSELGYVGGTKVEKLSLKISKYYKA